MTAYGTDPTLWGLGIEGDAYGEFSNRSLTVNSLTGH